MDSGVRNRFLLRSFSESNRITNSIKLSLSIGPFAGRNGKNHHWVPQRSRAERLRRLLCEIKRHVLIQFNKLFGWV